MTETDSTPLPPAARRLFRPRSGRLVGGVAAGLGTFTDIDPVFFRVVFGVLAFLGGAGILIYAVAWVLIPAEGNRSWFDQWVARPRSRAREWILAGLLTLAVLAVWGAAHWHRVPAVLLAVAALIGAIGLVRALPARPAVKDKDVATDEDDGPRVAIPRSPVTLPTIGLAVLVTGLLALLDANDVIDLSLSDVLACTLGVVVFGAVAARMLGRSRGLIVTAALLGVAVLLTHPLPGHLGWSFGERSWTPTSATQVPADYTLGAGRATLDLTRLPSTGNLSVHGAIGAGRLRVVVPDASAVTVHAHAGVGTVSVFGHSWHGVAVDREESDGAVTSSSGTPRTITLDLSAGYGAVQVVRATP